MGLADRLKRIRQGGSARPVDFGHGPGSRAVRDPDMPGWERISPCLHVRELRFKLDFPEEIDISPFLIRRLRQRAMDPVPEAFPVGRSRLRFIDTETTGLSTGAGTLAFAFGAARFEGGEVVLRQTFLSDICAEEAFLQDALHSLEDPAIMVSYNGSVYDSAVLRSRLIIHGRRFPEPPQLDLLFTARRLWSAPCGGASLPLIEAFVLGTPRIGDVDGSEAPERYRDWLGGAPFERIQPVLEHHARDILSLPLILKNADKAFRDPLARGTPLDPYRMGVILHQMGRQGWDELFRLALAGSGEREKLIMASILGREGRYKEALDILLSLPVNAAALLAAAKVLEHRQRDYKSALALVEKGIALGIDMEGRRKRILRKLEKTNL